LRERRADILPLAESMLAAAAARGRRGHLRLSAEAAQAISCYEWPGNLRELCNAMEAAAVLCQGERVALANLPEAVLLSSQATPFSGKTRLDEMVRQHIARVLAESATLEQAAATLGIDPSTLWRKRKRYNLDATVGSKPKGSVA
jgi:two-component system, NtrC family, response regulator AlgB